MNTFVKSSSGVRFLLIIAVFQILLLLSGIYGCALSPDVTRERAESSATVLRAKMEESFQRAERLFQEGKYDLSSQAYSDFLETFPASPFESQTFQRLGEINFLERDYPVAIKYLGLLVQKYPLYPALNKVKLELAYSYFYLKDIRKTKEIIKEIKSEQLKGGERNDFSYLQAQVAWQEKDYLIAFEKLVGLVETPPEGITSDEIKREIEEIVMKFFSPERLRDLTGLYTKGFPAAFLRWQLVVKLKDRGEMEEAKRVLEDLVVSFPGSPWTSEALDMLTELATPSTKASAMKKLPGDKPPIIGVILPLSGVNSKLGMSVLNGVELSYTRSTWAITGEIQLLIKDDQSDPQKAFDSFRELSRNERVLAVIGPVYEEASKEIAALAENFRLPTFSPASESLQLNRPEPYFFRNSLTDHSEAKSLAYYVYDELGIRYLAVAFPNNSLGIELKNYFSQSFQEKGGQMVISYHYPPETVDFTEVIEDLISRGVNFQALFVPDNYQAGVMIASQLAFHELTGVQLIGTGRWDFSEFLKFGGTSIEGAIFSSEFYPHSVLPQIRRFVDFYQEQFQQLPDSIAAKSYDIANILMRIIGEGATDREKVKARLLKVRNYHGVSGLLSMTPNGDVQRKLTVLRVEGGRLIQLQ